MALDTAIVATYLGAILLAGLLLGRRHASVRDYFLASRSARWPALGLALVASNVSPAALIGISGSAYAIGISVYNYEWLAAVILVVFATLFLPTMLASGVYTVPEFLERRYDGRLRLWFSGLTIALNILMDTAGALYAGMILLRVVFPSVGEWQALVFLAALAGAYAITGGLRAIIYTEALQAVVVLSGAMLLTWFAFDRAGGWSLVMSSVDPEKLSLIRPLDDAAMPWTGVAFGAPILGFYYWCTNQYMVQKMLAARTLEDGQKGAMLAGGLKLMTLFVLVLPGTAALVLYPDLEVGETAYSRMVVDLLPSGLLGLVLAAFYGALLAQLSAAYNAVGTLVSLDFVRKLAPAISEKRLVTWGRVGTFSALLLSVLWAPQIARFPSLWQYLQSVMAYATPPVVVLFVFGVLWQRASAFGALASVVAGTMAGAALFVGNVADVVRIHFLHVAAIVFLVSSLAMVAGSLLKPVNDAAAAEMGRSLPRLSAWRVDASGTVKLMGVVVILAAAAIVFWFR